jgi:hypothetical protein
VRFLVQKRKLTGRTTDCPVLWEKLKSVIRGPESKLVPSWKDFADIQLRASIHTTGLSFQIAPAISFFMQKWPELFSKIVFASDLPSGTPGEVPRLILESADASIRLQAGPSRVEILRTNERYFGTIDIRSHFDMSCDVFAEYQLLFQTPVARVAAVLTRVASDPAPGETLSRHFCRDAWVQEGGLMAHPVDFELNTATSCMSDNGLRVNCWFKCKAAIVTKIGATPLIYLDQEINFPEKAATVVLVIDDIRKFFVGIPHKFGEIMALYFA